MDKDIVKQTKNAFDFVQKLFFEISYLIKEIEGMLQEEEEKFIIIKSSGYSVTTPTSIGLETKNVEKWLSKNFTVFFISEMETEIASNSVTETMLENDPRIMVVHINLLDKSIKEPQIFYGYIEKIKSKKEGNKKFEKLNTVFYNWQKIFIAKPDIHYEDTSCSFIGKFETKKLFDIENTEDIKTGIINPLLNLYRSV